MKTLGETGFKVRVVAKPSDAKKGTVIAQSPKSGKLQPGKTVAITVSTGVQMVRVPDVIGGTAYLMPDEAAARARQLLAASGLKPNVFFDQMSAQYQSPRAGSMVPKGTVVKVSLLLGE